MSKDNIIDFKRMSKTKNQTAGEDELKVKDEPKDINNDEPRVIYSEDNNITMDIKEDTETNIQKAQKLKTNKINHAETVDPDEAKLIILGKNEPGGEEIKNEKYTPLEINFVALTIVYNNQTKAYMETYGLQGYSIEYPEVSASEVMQRPRMKKLRDYLTQRMVRQTEKKLQWSFEQSAEALKSLVSAASEELALAKAKDPSKQLTLNRIVAIRDAVKELNIMFGYTDKSVKINNSVTIVGSAEDLPD